jgi:hypothetical protein
MSLNQRKQERDYTTEVKSLQTEAEELAKVCSYPDSSAINAPDTFVGWRAFRCCRQDLRLGEADPKCESSYLLFVWPGQADL